LLIWPSSPPGIYTAPNYQSGSRQLSCVEKWALNFERISFFKIPTDYS
jgi:hypothetical protein